jgi:hypothetical protein
MAVFHPHEPIELAAANDGKGATADEKPDRLAWIK